MDRKIVVAMLMSSLLTAVAGLAVQAQAQGTAEPKCIRVMATEKKIASSIQELLVSGRSNIDITGSANSYVVCGW